MNINTGQLAALMGTHHFATTGKSWHLQKATWHLKKVSDTSKGT